MSRNQGGLLQYFFGKKRECLISYQVLILRSNRLGEARLYSEEGSSIEQVETAHGTREISFSFTELRGGYRELDIWVRVSGTDQSARAFGCCAHEEPSQRSKSHKKL